MDHPQTHRTENACCLGEVELEGHTCLDTIEPLPPRPRGGGGMYLETPSWNRDSLIDDQIIHWPAITCSLSRRAAPQLRATAIDMDCSRSTTLRITGTAGLIDVLQEEVIALGLSCDAVDATAVEVQGSLLDAMRLNLHLTTAMSVRALVERFPCDDPDTLYRHINNLPWDDMIPADGYLTVTSSVRHPSISNTMFANVRVKDAIVDRIRKVHGARPDSGSDPRGVVVYLHWSGSTASIWLDTSGRKLSDRGYRRMPHRAPMRETIAAAILRKAHWTGDTPLVVPMCGSGTIAIEAALMASGRPPGLLRTTPFGFEHLIGFDRAQWQAIRAEATPSKSRRRQPLPQIIANDIDPEALQAIERNAQTAGCAQHIACSVCDFRDTPLPSSPGTIVYHPGYGLRLGEDESLEPLYKHIGDHMKQQCGGWQGWVFTGNLELAKRIGLRPSCRIPVRHANLEARLLGFELWQGSDDPASQGAAS